jgi:queuosine precursor transporter
MWAALGCIAAGVGVSAIMAGPALALASGAAFALSELADTAIYEPLRNRGRVRALAWSNLVGSVVDSIAFLAIAGFPIWPAVIGQVGVKWVMAVGLPLLAVRLVCAVRRHNLLVEEGTR